MHYAFASTLQNNLLALQPCNATASNAKASKGNAATFNDRPPMALNNLSAENDANQAAGKKRWGEHAEHVPLEAIIAK